MKILLRLYASISSIPVCPFEQTGIFCAIPILDFHKLTFLYAKKQKVDSFGGKDYNHDEEQRLFEAYFMQKKNNKIIEDISFEEYKAVNDEIKSKSIGLTTADGITIKSYTAHFIERTIGQTKTPVKGLRQETPIDASVDALLHPTKTADKEVENPDGTIDVRRNYKGLSADVAVSITDNRLIQCNPARRKK